MSEDFDSGTPHINVFSLGKFEFCYRAGILAIESRMPDNSDQVIGNPKLNHIPIFDTALMNRRREEAYSEIKINASLGFAFGVVVFLLNTYSFTVLAWMMGVFAVLLISKAFVHFQDYREIKKRLSMSNSAEVAKLGDTGAGFRTINWWALCKDEEFNPTTPVAAFVSHKLGLSGKPAQIATYRGMRIPVILHQDELDKAKSYHQVRLAAYALLIEENQKAKPTDWGIVLDPVTMRGIAVPINDNLRTDVINKLKRFKRQLAEVRNGTDPAPPSSDSVCRNCPHGSPRVYRLGVLNRGQTSTMRDGHPLPALAKRGNDGRKYHSACGDRFKWVPPHILAFERELKKS